MTEASNLSPGNYRLGLIFVTASAIAWSTAGLFTRIISLDVGTMLVWRGVFGALGILAVAKRWNSHRCCQKTAYATIRN